MSKITRKEKKMKDFIFGKTNDFGGGIAHFLSGFLLSERDRVAISVYGNGILLGNVPNLDHQLPRPGEI